MGKEPKTTPWLTVPQFGDWDLKNGVMPDYSMDFSKIREMRKQNKRDVSRASLGNEEELVSSVTTASMISHDDDYHRTPTAKRRFFKCFNCCVKA